RDRNVTGVQTCALPILLKIHIPVIEIIVDEKTYFVRDTSFTLSWIHSVEKEPWYEIYKRKNSHLILTETYFKTFGAGVPSNKEIIKKNNRSEERRVGKE